MSHQFNISPSSYSQLRAVQEERQVERRTTGPAPTADVIIATAPPLNPLERYLFNFFRFFYSLLQDLFSRRPENPPRQTVPLLASTASEPRLEREAALIAPSAPTAKPSSVPAAVSAIIPQRDELNQSKDTDEVKDIPTASPDKPAAISPVMTSVLLKPTAANMGSRVLIEQRLAEIRELYDVLADKVTLKFEGRLDVTPRSPAKWFFIELGKQPKFAESELESFMRKQWESSISGSVILVEKAAAEMLTLLRDLSTATAHIPDQEIQYLAMARLLQQTAYVWRFNLSKQTHLLYLYRFIRGKFYFVHCPNVDFSPHFSSSKKVIFTMRLTKEDIAPYTQTGTPEFKMREIYNQVIKQWARLGPYLGNASHLLVPDDGTEKFKIIPPIST